MTTTNHVPVLADARVLVVGSGRTGRATARQAPAAGADVTLSGRSAQRLSGRSAHRPVTAPSGIRIRTEAAEPEAPGPEDPKDAVRLLGRPA